MSVPNFDLAAMVQTVSQSPDYRVLRRLQPREITKPNAGTEHRIGMVLDVETTGLDTGKDEVIELGMVKFAYLPSGEVTHIVDVYEAFNEPSIAIPPEIVELTGITDDMVAGHRIPEDDVIRFASDAVVVIAHNANFDRRFCERFWPMFESTHWACSATQIEWRKLGFEGSRLAYLLAGCGYFHDKHRAADDCRALLEVIASKPSDCSKTALALMLECARKPSIRVWAEHAPYELRDVLKKRKYRWNDGSDGRAKSWFVDVDEEGHEAELKFLHQEIYRREVDLRSERITALLRFSKRA